MRIHAGVDKYNLDALFRPRSVALVGASADKNKLTGRPLDILRMHGYEGDIWVVNNRSSQVGEFAAFRSVDQLPGVPDVALVMVPAIDVPSTARALAEIGARSLVILSSGFEEAGKGSLAQQLRDVSETYGVGIVGPNSEGIWNVPSRTILTFGSAARRPTLLEGPVAVLSQSGGIGGALMRNLNDSGLGCDIFVSVGNETVLSVGTYLDWILDNTQIEVVLCFLEGLADGRGFMEAVKRANTLGVAVVVLKSGNSIEGRAATASHTGKISTRSAIYESMLRQCGAVAVDTLEELALAPFLFTGPRLGADNAESRGVAVLGLSGGTRGLIADACDADRVPMAKLTDSTTRSLSEFVPSFGVVTNPVDPTGQVLSKPRLLGQTITALASDQNTEALILQFANAGLKHVEAHLDVIEAALEKRSLPVVVSCLLDQLPRGSRLEAALAQRKLLFVPDPRQAVRALSLLYRHRERSLAPMGMLPVEPRDPQFIAGWKDILGFVEGTGVRAPHEVEVDLTSRTDSSLSEANCKVTLPAVVKPSPDDIPHKSDHGLVSLDLRTWPDVNRAIQTAVGMLPSLRRIMVQEFKKPIVEMLVVFEDDPDFGKIMGVGPGGYLVDLIGDLEYVALPATVGEVVDAISRTTLSTLFNGYRGKPIASVEHIGATLSSLGERYAQLIRPPRLLEMNPICTVEYEENLYVLDALIEPPRTDDDPHSIDRSL